MIAPRDPWQPLPPDWREQVTAKWPNAERLSWAWRLARDPETCGALIAGHPVDQRRLDPDALLEARRRSLVQLRAPLELLNVVEEAA